MISCLPNGWNIKVYILKVIYIHVSQNRRKWRTTKRKVFALVYFHKYELYFHWPQQKICNFSEKIFNILSFQMLRYPEKVYIHKYKEWYLQKIPAWKGMALGFIHQIIFVVHQRIKQFLKCFFLLSIIYIHHIHISSFILTLPFKNLNPKASHNIVLFSWF